MNNEELITVSAIASSVTIYTLTSLLLIAFIAYTTVEILKLLISFKNNRKEVNT